MHAYLLLQAPPAATGTGQSADDRNTTFRPVEGGGEMQSGEKLLVIAYMVIWVALMGLVILSFRRQNKLDRRIVSLETSLMKERMKGAPAAEKGAD